MTVAADALVKQVQWGEGPLGLLLTPDVDNTKPPRVARITDPDAAPARANVLAGDIFVRINGLSTAELGYIRVLQMLRRDPRPMTLAFCVGDLHSLVSARSLSRVVDLESIAAAQPIPEHTYPVVLTDGPVGFVLRTLAEDSTKVCVARITGEGPSVEGLVEGDLLVAVNGQLTTTLGYDASIDMIISARRPVTLHFQSARAVAGAS